MDDFAVTLQRWQLFYATIATSSATLTGLLFVALSLERGRSAEGERAARLRVARGSLADFLYVLMLSVVFLVPDQSRGGFAVAILVLTLARGIGLLSYLVHPTRRRRSSVAHRIREIALPLAAVLGLAGVAIAILNGLDVALYGLVGVLAALIARATWTAWLLLTGEVG